MKSETNLNKKPSTENQCQFCGYFKMREVEGLDSVVETQCLKFEGEKPKPSDWCGSFKKKTQLEQPKKFGSHRTRNSITPQSEKQNFSECQRCHKPIINEDNWVFNPEGRGLVHKECKRNSITTQSEKQDKPEYDRLLDKGYFEPENTTVDKSSFSITVVEEKNKKKKKIEEEEKKKKNKSNSSVILKPSSYDIRYKDVYQWASELTCEQNPRNMFFWTPQTNNILRRLSTTKNQLIAIVGLQGTGKTAFYGALWTSLQQAKKKVVATKWFGEKAFIDALKDQSISEPDLEMIVWELEHKIGKAALLKWEQKNLEHNIKSALRSNDENYQLKEVLLNKLGAKRREKLFRQTTYDNLCNHTILIDLRDYDKNIRTQMIKDLNDIHNFWENLNYDGSRETNLVVFMQKELFHGHFFFGKMDVVELEPFKPEQLVECYEKLFGHTEPFTKDALLDLAVLSRGIFRRFKKYIRICLDYLYSNKVKVITKKETRNIITLKQLHKDMELELSNLYPKSRENRKQSVILLQLLAKHGSIEQQDLAKKLFGATKTDEVKTSRLLNKLEAYDYVKRETKGNNKKLVSLK